MDINILPNNEIVKLSDKCFNADYAMPYDEGSGGQFLTFVGPPQVAPRDFPVISRYFP